MDFLFPTLLAAAPAAKNPSFFDVFVIPMAIIFSVFYFLIIRPQSKKAKQQQSMLSALKKGDDVVTSSGIFGKITGLTDQVATLEIAPNTKIKIMRANIHGLSNQPQPEK